MKKPVRQSKHIKNGRVSWYEDWFSVLDRSEETIRSWWKAVADLPAPRCGIGEMTDYGTVVMFVGRKPKTS